MSDYKTRILEEELRAHLAVFPVVGVTGPRQSGKSTLLREVLPTYDYVTFDSAEVRASFYDDPVRFMRLHCNQVIFDEVHKVPELFERVKISVDEDRQAKGKFILTSSNQLELQANISESLAGRIGLLCLLPFEFSEIPPQHAERSIYSGCYPEVVSNDYHHAKRWYSSYVDTYLNRDVRQLSHIGELRDFHRLLNLVAVNIGQTINFSRFAADVGVDLKTIKRWISVLEASYIIFLLPPYYKNMGKRIVKSPKLYFYDTGLAAHITNIESESDFEKGPLSGALFENYIISETLKLIKHRKRHLDIFFYRTSNGVEVDLILDNKRTLHYIEIKKSETFLPRMTKPINAIRDQHEHATIVYRGLDQRFDKNFDIRNYKTFLKELAEK